MGPILCSKEIPKSSLSNIDVQWSFFKGVIERQRWVLSTAGQNSQYQNVEYRVYLTARKGGKGCCLLQDKTSIEKSFFPENF
jgi:hypothetical protein